MLLSLFYIVIFPGFIFLSVYGCMVEYMDRKLYARFQNRIGPPWCQPFADFIKLIGKEAIIPEKADKAMFRILPAFALASASATILYIPLWSTGALFSFKSDLIVVLYLLTIPTITFFIAGWSSTSLYSTLGSIRTLTQLFAYEVPLYMALLGPALLAGTWSISEIATFYYENPLLALCNIPGFIVAIIALQGKLERVPFDTPEAETEIVAGSFTEYSGRYLALFRMTIDIEMLVLVSLIGAIFFPVYFPGNTVLGVITYFLKTIILVFILALVRSLMARLRIEQMVKFCWKYLAPAAIFQILIDVLVKGAL
ncbi:MAG TPA: NADH-quinone oxidoreductase subunit H [Bacteroidales bacterium]|nr:NADH-quinone oxidoreductase subunit H [Bacteroidales bacterium]HQG53313.1 NADH-quinone oxidoreductase subunit H [Bacteroidales bacterium]HRC89795.1 NADH-quinone oxidoreductase subunit H [Bacteroidales bacterium]